jgi:hypothetical protein
MDFVLLNSRSRKQFVYASNKLEELLLPITEFPDIYPGTCECSLSHLCYICVCMVHCYHSLGFIIEGFYCLKLFILFLPSLLMR